MNFNPSHPVYFTPTKYIIAYFYYDDSGRLADHPPACQGRRSLRPHLPIAEKSRSGLVRKPARLLLLRKHLGRIAPWALVCEPLVGEIIMLAGIFRSHLPAGTGYYG